jgi:hypothetical protein
MTFSAACGAEPPGAGILPALLQLFAAGYHFMAKPVSPVASWLAGVAGFTQMQCPRLATLNTAVYGAAGFFYAVAQLRTQRNRALGS